MPVLTLISDMGLRDYYVGVLKGAIYTELAEVVVVDISHDIPPFDIANAAFVLRNSYHHFPKGSAHIIGVNPDLDLHEKVMHVLVMYRGHYFIGADNGIFSLMFDGQPDAVYELNMTQAVDELTFPTKDVFVPAACHLLRGGTPEIIGRRRDSLKTLSMFRPVIDNDTIRGSIIYIDSYGNAFTNITKQLFREVSRGRNFKVIYGGSNSVIRDISDAYNNVPEGERLALFGSEGYLEIAINRGAYGAGGSAASLLGLKINQAVRIEFL